MGKHGAAGRPPHPAPEETILPTGESSELDTDVHHLPTFNQGIRLIGDEVPTTGFGSARHRQGPALGPAAKAFVREQRGRTVKRIAFAVLFASLAITLLAAAAYFAYTAWGYRNALTYIEQRENTPVFAFLSLVLLLAVGFLTVLYWERRR